jgi:hypothetical protein
MDDELHQLEAELKALRPTTPSRGLVQRLEMEFAAQGTEARPVHAARRWWLWAGALPAAAALAVAFTLGGHREPAPSASVASASSAPQASSVADEQFKPVAAENVLYAVNDEGLVTLDDGTAARRERLSYVDTITWKNPRTNASVRWTVPREEIRVVPVKFQ